MQAPSQSLGKSIKLQTCNWFLPHTLDIPLWCLILWIWCLTCTKAAMIAIEPGFGLASTNFGISCMSSMSNTVDHDS